MNNWIRRHHKVAFWVVGAALSIGKLNKFLHTLSSVSGGGRKFS
jgi:hypothetical protein